ncbi:MAG: TolC family protein [Candidatus Omnitrophota bacterium]|nr:MAG: TolC family protein [Candidatus Omnitrophota bacterium]
MENRRNIFIIVILLFLSSIPLVFAEDAITAYVSVVNHKIATHIKKSGFPKTSVPAGKIRTVLEIDILSNGSIYLVKVIESSGIADFDKEAKNLVKTLAPYPAFPSPLKSRLTIRLPIEVVGQPQGERLGARDEMQRAERKKRVETTLRKKELVKDKEKPIKDIRKKEALSQIKVGDKFLKEKEKIRGLVDEVENLYKIALDNSDPAKVAQQQLGLARLKINEARRNLFPKMEFQYSISEGQTITDPYESQSYALQFRQNLFDNGKTAKNLRKEKLNLEVAEKEYEKTVQELKFEVERSYLNVLGKQEELKEVESFKEEVSHDYELAKDIYEPGAISRVEFIEIEAEYQRTTNMISQINNELMLAREKLRASMNLLPQAQVQIEQLSLPQLGEMDINVDDCISLALENKPEVRLWEISLEAAKYAKDIAGSENVPKLDFVSSYGASGEAFSDQDLNLAEEWKLMGVVTWLFGGNSFEVSTADERVSSKDVTEIDRKIEATTYTAKMGIMDKMQYYVQKKEAEIAYAQNVSNLSKNKQEVVFDTRKSFLEYRQSFDEYQVALFEAKFSGVNLDLKRESFKIGKAGLSEVAKARADYMRKRLALLRAKTSYFISLASLDKATAYSLGLFPDSENSSSTEYAKKVKETARLQK